MRPRTYRGRFTRGLSRPATPTGAGCDAGRNLAGVAGGTTSAAGKSGGRSRTGYAGRSTAAAPGREGCLEGPQQRLKVSLPSAVGGPGGGQGRPERQDTQTQAVE